MLTRSGEKLSIRGKCDLLDLRPSSTGNMLKGSNVLLRADIPQSEGPIIATAGKQLSIRGKYD